MSPELIILIMFGGMIGLLMTGTPIFAVVGMVAVTTAMALWGGSGAIDMAYISAYSSIVKWYPLLAIPLFVFMGLTLSKSGLGDDLFHAMDLWVGHIRGGLLMGTVALCSLIAAMSGLSVAATTISGTIALPAMLKRGYDKRLVVGTVLAAGALGFLIPPSIVFILYGMIARVTIGHLWLAGVFPGALLAGMYIGYVAIRTRLQPHLAPLPRKERPGWQEKVASLKAGAAPLILIFIVIGLLYMGVTTIIECGAVGAVGALTVALIYRRFNWAMFREVLNETLHITCLIMWIFAAAIMFGAIFNGLGAVDAVKVLLIEHGGTGLGAVSMMMTSFIGMGMILDDTAMLLVVAPLYIPTVSELGFSLVWYGVLYVITCQMAYITPPFGYNLFILRGIAPKEITLTDIYKSALPFVAIQAITLAILMRFPEISLWLPRVVFGPVIGLGTMD